MAGTNTSNHKPVVKTDTSAAIFIENDSPLPIAGALVITDAENSTLVGARVVISQSFAPGQDVLSFSPVSGISASWDALTGTLTFTGTATLAQYQDLLRSVTYSNTSDDPSSKGRTVSFQVDDGQAQDNLSSTMRVKIKVDAVNDAPHLTVDPTLTYVNPQATEFVDASLVLVDPDSDPKGAQVSITGNYVRGQDVLQATEVGHLRVRFSESSGVLTISGKGTVAQYQEVLRSVTYTNTSATPSMDTRTLEFRVEDKDHSDGVMFSNVAVVSVVYAAPPVVTTSGTPVAYTEGGAAFALAPALTVTDADDANLAGATVTISSGFQDGDALVFAGGGAVSGSYNAATGVLTLSGTATVAQYQAAMRTVQFVSTNDNPGTAKTITWVANDGTDNSNPVTTTIAVTPVNDVPLIAVDASLAYTENGSPAPIAPAATVSDVDSADFSAGTLTVSFTANGTAADQLTILNVGSGAGQIGVSGGSVTYGGAAIGTYTGGTNGSDLVVTFNSAAATPAAVQALVRDIAFANSSDNPATAARTVTFTVTDGDGGTNGVAAETTVNLTATNDAPALSASAGAAYTEGAAALVIDTALTITDPDNTNLASATVSVSSSFQIGDSLAFVDTPEITGSYNSSTGVLTLTGTATVAQYQAALRTVTFATTTNDDPATSKSISWTVNDGTDASNTGSTTITITPVNDAPLLTVGATLGYTENGAAAAIAPAATVADADSADFSSGSLSVAFTANGTADDQLTIINVGTGAGEIGAAAGSITYGGAAIGTYTGGANGAALSISLTTAAATPAAVQALVRSIAFANTSDNPSTLARTLTFTVVDGDGGTDTATSTATVNVIAVNDIPEVTAAASLAYTEGQAATAVDGTLTLADLDTATLTGATVSITGGLDAGDLLSFTGASGITGSYVPGTGVLTLSGTATVAQYQSVLRTVTFASTSDDPGTSRTIAWVVNDGADNSAAALTTVTVTPVNDAPSITTTATLAYTENDAATAISPAATVSDVDSADFNGGSLTVSYTANASADDQLTVLNQGTGSGQISVAGGTVSYEGVAIGTVAGGTAGTSLAITFNSAAATPQAVQALVRDIAYANSSDSPSTLARTLSFSLVDGDGGTQTGTSGATVNVTAVNDAPTLTASLGSAAYTEAGAAVAVDASIAISDPDNSTFTSATVQVTSGFLTGEDVLAFSSTGATGNIAASAFNATTGTLTLSSSGGSATTAQWQAALAAVTFDSSSTSPGTSRTVSFQLDDGQAANHLSAVVTKTIAITEVNSQPTVTTTGGSAAFVEDTSGAVAVDNGIVLDDPDTASLAGATAHIASGFQSAQDVLAFTPVGAITGSYNSTTGTLTLSGAGTLAQYQTALASVTYDNTSNAPDTTPRVIEFQVDDGQSVSNLSTVATRTVTVAATNDAPSLTVGATLAYTENDPATAIAPAALVTDPDSTDFNGGTLAVSFTAGGTAADQLAITNQGTSSGQIGVGAGTISYEGTGIATFTGGSNGSALNITFNSASATPAAVQALVHAITFANTSESPSTSARTVTYTVTDGDGGTNSATATVNVTAVNDAPAVTGSVGTPMAYIENDAATVIDGGLTLADVDSTNLTGATVSIGANFASGQDVLAFTPGGGITGSFNSGSGVLTLSGSASLAAYETALHSVTYANSSENPSIATRTVSIQVDDGAGLNHASNAITRDITVTSVNDAPAITSGASVSYTENAAAKIVSSGLTLSDAEGDSITGATATIAGNFASGQDSLTFTPTGAITGSFNSTTGVLSLSGTGTTAEYQSVLRSVSYVNSSEAPSTAARTISFQATDSHGDTGAAATATVTVVAVNDAPVTVVPVNDTVGTAFSNTALSISGVSLSDVDAGASNVQTTVSAESGALTFSLSGSAGATGNGTGSVVLTGTLTDINNTLASLSYKSNDGFTGIDSVLVTTSDLGNTGTGGALGSFNSFFVGVVPQVFIIDNTDAAVDSASSGTAANPFNSIAAFNSLAADGTGDYIYLKQGTGTYAEADGFNLLTDQHLVGQGQTLSFTNPLTGAVVTVGTGSSGATPTVSITGAGNHAVDLATGNTVSGLNIATTLGSQTGIADGGGTVGALTVSDVDVTGAGMAVDIDQGGVLDVVIDKLTSTGSTQQGVQLAGTTLSGSFSAGATAGSAISGSSGTAFLVGDGAGTAGTGGTATISFAGTVSSTGTARTVDIEDRASGAGTVTLSGNLSHTGGNASGVVISDIADGDITLSGTSSTLNTGTAGAVVVSNASGATVNFTGSLDIDTTSGVGISLASNGSAINFTGPAITINSTTAGGTGISLASNSGAVTFNNAGATSGLDIVTSGATGIAGTSGTGSLTIQGTSNTISSTGASAIDLNGVTIAAGGLNFVSVASSGAANGVVLTNTGSTGSLTVTGSGSAGTGGTISGATGDGIVVTNGSINLGYMVIQNPAGAGILATNLVGTNTLSNSTITGFDNGGTNTDNGFTIVNNGNNLGSLTVSNTTFSNGATGNDGIFMEAQGSSNMTLKVVNSTFTGLFGDGVQVNGTSAATGTVKATISGSLFTSAVASTGNGGISLNPFGSVNFFADVDGNTLTGVMNNVVNLGAIGVTNGDPTVGGSTSNADITIHNNTITNIAGGRGISITSDGGATDLLIDNNKIDSLGSTSKPAISVNFTDNTVAGTTGSGNVTISNNDIGQTGPLWTSGNGATNAILVQTQGASTLTAALTGNVVDGNDGSVIAVVRVRAIGTSTLNATVTGNDIQDTETTSHVEFDATAGVSSTQAGTVNLSIGGSGLSANNFNTGGVVQLTENSIGTLNVTQASSAAVASANGGVTVTSTGSPNYGSAAPPTPATPSLPLVTHDDLGAGNGGTLSLSDLGSIAAAAVHRWEALPLSDAQKAVLGDLSFGLADMSGTMLGTAVSGKLVLIDLNAAGHGWYVDASPLDDSEFTTALTATHLVVSPEAAAGRLDLLTAVMHEIGHVLGLDDAYAQGNENALMYGYLDAGERRLPGQAEVLALVGIGQSEMP